MIVLDASVVIAVLDDDDAHHESAVDLLDAVGTTPLAMSPLTVAEVLVGPTRRGRQLRTIEDLARLKVQEVPLQRAAGQRLAALRAHTNLKLPDCCVLLAAEDVAATSVATFDHRLAVAVRDRGLRVLGAAA